MTDPAFEFDLQHLLAEETYVRRLARGLLFDEHKVDDVVQQTWIAALRHPPRGEPGLRAWIAGVVRRVAANEVRSEVRRTRRERRAAGPEAVQPSADEVLAREERRREVVDALQALAEPYRSAVALRYLEGLEPGEIARRRGVPAATVRTQVRRGLELMRERLDQQHGGDRAAWCTAILPLLRGRDAATVGMATTLLGVLAMKKILFATAAAALALLAYAVWPTAAAPAPNPGAAVTTAPIARADVGAPARPGIDAGSERTPLDAPRATALLGDATGDLHGRLLAPDGAPLGGARLAAFAFDGTRLFGDATLPSVDARTADDGTFTLRGLPMRARCAVIADADGDLRQLVPLPASPQAGLTTELGDLRLEERAVLTGTVTGPDGAPRSGAEVWCADVPALVLAALPIDRLVPEQGVLAMLPRPDRAQLADPKLWNDAARSHLARKIVTEDYGTLPNEAFVPLVLDGTVVRGLWDKLPIARACSDRDGRFRLVGVAPGANLLVARANGLLPATRASVMARPGPDRDVGTLRLERGETLGGRVLDHAGTPVAGARVRAAAIGLLGFHGLAPCEAEVATGADGAFTVPGLARGKVLVAFRGSDGEPWRAVGPLASDDDVDLSLPAPSVLRLQLQLPAGTDPASVRLLARPAPPLGELSRLGFAARFAEVPLQGGESPTTPTVELTAGVWTLRCEAPGCAPAVRMVSLPDDAEVRFALQRRVELVVIVRDAFGVGCPDARVFVQQDGDPDAQRVMASSFGLATFVDGWPQATARTDAAGTARLVTAPGKLRVSASCGGRGAAVAAVEVPETPLLELRLDSPGAIEGRVEVGASLGGDPQKLRIVADLSWSATVTSPTGSNACVRPDGDGAFRIDGLAPGAYEVALYEALPRSLTITGIHALLERNSRFFAQPERIDAKAATVAPGGTARVQFAVGGLDPQLGGVTGTARLDGVPAAGCTVWARDRQRMGEGFSDGGWEDRARATIAADGSFVVDDLEPRTWWLGLRDGKDGEFVHVFEVDVTAGVRTPVAADVRFGRVHGVIRSADGAPAADVTVLVASSADPSMPMLTQLAHTDARGQFACARLPAGPCAVQVEERYLRVARTVFEVLPGDATPPLDLTAARRHRLSVQLVGDDAATADAMLGFCVRKAGMDGGSTSVGAKRSAEFGLDDAGDYEVLVRIDGTWYATEPPRVRVSEPDTSFEVRRGAPAALR